VSVCLSDVAYIGSNSKTKRPRRTKLCTGVPQVTCDSHTNFKVKSQGHGAGVYCGGHLATQLVQRKMTQKWYKIELYIQWPTYRKSYVIYSMAQFSMNLNDPYPQCQVHAIL